MLVARSPRYWPFSSEQWVEAVFHVPESLTQVSLQDALNMLDVLLRMYRSKD
jgi:hypothetical protein